jgi:hypothetical protein
VKRVFLLTFLLLFSCEPAVRRILNLTFNDTAELVTITATTSLGNADPGSPEYAQIRDEREALLAGRDEWSTRFTNADPESDRVVMDRKRGQLQSLQHTATINSDNLQKFFFDTDISVTLVRAEGWAELTIYPGTSKRATRQQRDRVEKMLAIYSEAAARYFAAIRSMYLYLDEKPYRAHVLFTDVFSDDKDPAPILSERERSLTRAIKEAAGDLGQPEKIGAPNLDREFDLVFNPFPAELRVKVPGEVLINESFTKMDDLLAVKMPNTLDAVAELQGRWVTPDPLAVDAGNSDKKKAPGELALAIESLPRRTDVVVSASEIAQAMMEKMRPAPRYRVRWVTKTSTRR